MTVFQFNPGTRILLYTIMTVVYVFIFAPILFVIYGSFDPNEVMRFPYSGFSFRWYEQFFRSPMLYIAGGNSVLLAALSGFAATALGALAAYAVVRLSFRGKMLLQLGIGTPMVISKIVLGVALLTMMVSLGLPRGVGGLVALHALLCLPFAYIVVWAYLQSAGRDYEEAALSLGADDLRTTVEVTIPLMTPALVGSFLLCLTVSFDEFSATQFLVTPSTQTMPIQIYSMIQTGVNPTVNVFATVLTVVTIAIPLIAQLAFGTFRRMTAAR